MKIKATTMTKKKPICLNCGTALKPLKDQIAKKITGYLFRCPKCDPENKVVISIG